MTAVFASKTIVRKCLKTVNPAWVNYLHVSVKKVGTHDYDAIDYAVPANSMQDFIRSPSILNEIRKNTGAVVRHKDLDESNLLIVGSTMQVKIATQQIKAIIDGTTPPKSEDMFSEQNKKLIWHGYKRNFKGQYPPAKPRKKCIRCGGKMISGNPCPLCQLKLKSNYDIHYTDVEILNQFICPHTWNILDPFITGVCKRQQAIVEAAIAKACLYGLLPFTLPLPSDEPTKHKPAGVPTDRRIKVKMH